MATHGQMLVRDVEDKSRELILYTWHDGYTREAINLLLELPFILHQYSRLASEKWRLGKEMYHGPYYYDQIMDFALEAVKRGWLKEDRWNKDELKSHWMRSRFLETCISSVANWISFARFDTWTIIPDTSWTCYADEPDVIIDVQGGKLGGYTFKVQHEEECYLQDIDQGIEEANKKISDPEAKITILSQKNVLSDDKLSLAMPTVHVPVEKIILSLMLDEINRVYAVVDNNGQDEYVSAMIKRNKEVQARVRQDLANDDYLEETL